MRRPVVAAMVAVMCVPLSLVAYATPPAQSASGSAFAVGGGRYDTSECAINFSISAHASSTGANGTQTATMSNAPGAIAGCPGQGHIRATVTCIAVNGNQAEIQGIVTEATGSMGPPLGNVGDTFVTDIQDNGNPSSGTPDRIQQEDLPPGSTSGCSAPTSEEVFTVDNGNVTVHD